MPTMKRATAKLREAGIPLTVRKGLWGYWLDDPSLTRQTSVCHRTAQAAVDAALAGLRPQPATKEAA